MQRTRIAMAFTLAAGAFLYFSDHDTLDRHWRLALGLCVGALVVALSTLWPSGRPGRVVRIVMCSVLALSATGCGASRSTRGADAADRDDQRAVLPIGVGLVVVGCVLGIAAAAPGDPVTPPTFATLPTLAAPVHASFTPVLLPAHAGAR
ncbi:MAG TPA: hypothetical protein VM513_06010 [Kofleriaceae bacterium]|jgi:hypothetical protein|nr:hypothetical protein [Kofleriaceae bacterium]